MQQKDLKFDRQDQESPFLSFVRNEFQQRGTRLRKRLSNKEIAAKVVKELGLRTPKRHKLVTDLSRLRWFHLGRRSVVKYGKGWSSRGVMLLERTRINRYFDHMSLREHSLFSIRKYQQRVAESFGGNDPFWIVEELLEPTQAFGAIPFDYKFYVFGKQIGLVVQIDRNTSPPKIALFDGAFKPLVEGVDYLLASKNAQVGVHLVPPHAAELMWWALKLASATDAPFVSIDLYDTPRGPVFGEFTFSPGGTHKRMFKFSHSLLDYLDKLFAASEKALEEGVYEEENHSLSESSQLINIVGKAEYKAVQKTSALPLQIHKVWAGVAYNDGSIGALRLSEYFETQANKAESGLEKAVFRNLSRSWQAIHDNLKANVQNSYEEK